MKDKINVLYTTDKNYLMPMTVSITSLLYNNQDINLNIYVFYNDLLDSEIKMLRNLVNSFKKRIYLIEIRDRYFNGLPTLRWSSGIYYRLLVCDLLPNVSKIFYIDSDTIFNKNISELYNLNVKDLAFRASDKTEDSINLQIKKLGLKKEKGYFPSGAMLINLDICRKKLTYTNIIKIAEKYKNRLITPDQDILNIIFNGEIGLLPLKYNNDLVTRFNGNNWKRLRNKVDKKEVDDTVVFHYATGKPWNNIFTGSTEKIWYKYLKLSPYAYLYNKKYNTLKYKILRTGIMKVLFYEYTHLTPIINNFFLKILSKKRYNKFKNFYRKYVK